MHRGAYFAELRTTTVRKLLPESWGFLCPVHTPDGSPCGLLNHLSASCFVHVTQTSRSDAVQQEMFSVLRVLSQVGIMLVHGRMTYIPTLPEYLTVMVDGAVVGFTRTTDAEAVVAALRCSKVSKTNKVSLNLEIAYVPPLFKNYGGAFPGIYVFSTPSRMLRPVTQHPSGKIEQIGSLEQAFMHIRCQDGENIYQPHTHEENGPGTVLSVVASCTPWSDFNQSPRNMYQCQMGKQTMGVPLHSYCYRPDTKLYRLQTPQRPIALTMAYDDYHIDEYPLGTNAVVAVLSNTGYDMEDAMIMNKGSLQRGLAHATLYKTETTTIPSGSEDMFGRHSTELHMDSTTCKTYGFPTDARVSTTHLDVDGTARLGSVIQNGDAFCGVFNRVTAHAKLQRFKGSDKAVIDRVSMISTFNDKGRKETKLTTTFRYNRNPIIGDKFSSRHGQKGVLAFLSPEEDLPFIERTGIRPDILINPHAFPSRMTIGMLIESMASKAGALSGSFIDASPFRIAMGGEEFLPPLSEHGKVLKAHGYDYCGNETLVNGLTGEQFEVDIFVGLVYYQRLRHMVSDKFQVRSVGPNNPLTQQPIKGRRAGGGIRFGEMERDSLLAHGAAYLVHDRLHACSDRHVASICSHCGSILAPATTSRTTPTYLLDGDGTIGHTTASFDPACSSKIVCRVCNSGSGIEHVTLPFVFKYLAAELAAMNVRVGLTVGDDSMGAAP